MSDEVITKNVSRLTRLTCRHGYFLRVTEDRVEGSKDENDKYISLEMSSVQIGEVILKGIESKRYIAMSSTGSLYTTDELSSDCVFKEIFETQYNAYQSKPYPSWYLALTKRGQAKFGPKTAPGQRAVGFLSK